MVFLNKIQVMEKGKVIKEGKVFYYEHKDIKYKCRIYLNSRYSVYHLEIKKLKTLFQILGFPIYQTEWCVKTLWDYNYKRGKSEVFDINSVRNRIQVEVRRKKSLIRIEKKKELKTREQVKIGLKKIFKKSLF